MLLPKPFWQLTIQFAIATFLLSGLLACSQPESSSPNITTRHPTETGNQVEGFTKLPAPIAPLVTIIQSHFDALIESSLRLNQHMFAFAQTPEKSQHQATIQALSELHDLFNAGYILDEELGIYTITDPESGPMGLIAGKVSLNQHPLLPGYIDAIEGYPESGLVFTDIPITRASMEQEFQLGDPQYITLGFHPLKLLLRGEKGERASSAFAAFKPVSDSSSAEPNLRRTLYALVLAQEIWNDLIQLQSNWLGDILPQLASQPTDHLNSLALKINKKAINKLDNEPPEIRSPSDSNPNKRLALLQSLSQLDTPRNKEPSTN